MKLQQAGLVLWSILAQSLDGAGYPQLTPPHKLADATQRKVSLLMYP